MKATIALDWVLLVTLALAMLPVSVLLLQAFFAVLTRRASSILEVKRPPLAVLVPAHNEAQGIRATLAAILPQLNTGDRLVVVADNCSDDTANVASSAGAEVVERNDAAHRGKGYALDCGVTFLQQNPPKLVVIVDADCRVQPGGLDKIARLSATSGRPVQALYLMKSRRSAGKWSPIGEFAWVVKNHVRPLGFHRIGLPCQLMGTGMALPWTILRSTHLATGHIVEDMKMGLDFARAGTPPLFCPDALVLSDFPVNEEGSKSQRTRWEHGHLGMILGEVPKLFLEGAKGKGSGLIPLALDLCVPPLALLTLIVIGLLGLSAVHMLLSSSLVPFSVSLLLTLMFGLSIGLSWLRFGREIVSIGSLLMAFVYALRKVPLYVGFVFHRQCEWVRSKRDDAI